MKEYLLHIFISFVRYAILIFIFLGITLSFLKELWR